MVNAKLSHLYIPLKNEFTQVHCQRKNLVNISMCTLYIPLNSNIMKFIQKAIFL